MNTDKVKCDECGWLGHLPDVLEAKNPFNKNEMITGCPLCNAVDSMAQVCDEPKCWKVTSCGFNTPSGYRVTCGDHYRP